MKTRRFRGERGGFRRILVRRDAANKDDGGGEKEEDFHWGGEGTGQNAGGCFPGRARPPRSQGGEKRKKKEERLITV